MNTATATPATDKWSTWVGQPIRKKNRARFKGGSRTATVSRMIELDGGRPAFECDNGEVIICAAVHVSRPGVEQ